MGKVMVQHILQVMIRQSANSFCLSPEEGNKINPQQMGTVQNREWETQRYVFVNEVLLEHGLAHLFMLSMAAFRLQWQTSVVVTEAIWPASLKYLLSGPLRNSSLTLYRICCLQGQTRFTLKDSNGKGKKNASPQLWCPM